MIKNIEEQKQIFGNYTDTYISTAEDTKINGYIDKRNHSLFVLEEALLTDALFTNYNDSFKNLLALESLFHDIGRFEQLKVTGSFNDNSIKNFYNNMNDHGDLGSEIIESHGLLNELIPDIRTYDAEVQKVISAHAKVNPEILGDIELDYLRAFKNYDLKDLFGSNNATKQKQVLFATNTAIVQDVDRLDIFRKIVKGIWLPEVTQEKIDDDIFQMFVENRLPSMNELKSQGRWHSNIGHLVRMSFINQMNLVPVLIKIRNENLIDKIYQINGNEVVKPAYDYAKEMIDKKIEETEDGILVNRHK